jgi:hypothetical protein
MNGIKFRVQLYYSKSNRQKLRHKTTDARDIFRTVTDDQNAEGRDALLVIVDAAAKPTSSPSEQDNADSTNADMGKNSLLIYPNPVTDNFYVEINNNNKGKIIIQIVSPAGALINSLIFDKDQEMEKVNLSSRGLTPGVYFIRVQIGTWTDTKKMIKL